MKKVLVTGGSGYIGSMICMLLVSNGYAVINLDRIYKKIPGVNSYHIDLQKEKQVEKILRRENPDVIIHLAANHEVGESVLQPGLFYKNNVSNTISLLNSAIKTGVSKFIFSSSSSVYGNTLDIPTRETTAKNPVSPYGKTKSIVEDILEDYKDAFSLKFCILRYFNAAGASPDISHGYMQKKATHLIPIVSRCILKGEEFTVFGNDYKTKDGTCERDYTHVYDIATAHSAAIDYLENKDTGVFNIGTGVSNSILEVINSCEKISGKKLSYKISSRREGDPSITLADTSKAIENLTWKPIYALDDIIKHSLLWEAKNI